MKHIKLALISAFMMVPSMYGMLLDPRVPQGEEYDVNSLATLNPEQLALLEEKRRTEFLKACQTLQQLHAQRKELDELRSSSPADFFASLYWDNSTSLQVEENRQRRNSPYSAYAQALFNHLHKFHQNVPEGLRRPIARR